MIERHTLKVNGKCDICFLPKKAKTLVLKHTKTHKIICMICLTHIAERTNETIIEESMAKPENVKCPECGGSMSSRKNHRTGSRFWGCDKYPVCKGTRDTDGNSREERNNLKDDMDNEEHPIRWDRKN